MLRDGRQADLVKGGDLFLAREAHMVKRTALPECGEKGASYTVGGNVNWCSHHGEQYGGS